MTEEAGHTAPSRAIQLWTAAGAFAVFLVLLALVAGHWTPLDTVDIRIVTAAHRAALGNGWLRAAARIVSDVGSPVGVDVAAGVAAVVFLVARRMTAVVAVVVARLGELGTETAVKALVERARPVFVDPLATAGGSAFPSGHAAGSAALYGVLVLVCAPMLARRPRLLMACAATVFVLAVGVSRVLLGVHYPSDVVGGVALGLAWAAFSVGVSPFYGAGAVIWRHRSRVGERRTG